MLPATNTFNEGPWRAVPLSSLKRCNRAQVNQPLLLEFTPSHCCQWWLVVIALMKYSCCNPVICFRVLGRVQTQIHHPHVLHVSAVMSSTTFLPGNKLPAQLDELRHSALSFFWKCLLFPRKWCRDSRFLPWHQFLSAHFLACSLIWTFTSRSGCSPPPCLPLPCSSEVVFFSGSLYSRAISCGCVGLISVVLTVILISL